MGALANSEDPDEIPQKDIFHQGLYCLLRQPQSSGTAMYLLLRGLNYDPMILVCATTHLKIIWKNPLINNGLDIVL